MREKANAELKKQQKPGTAPEGFLNAERAKIVLRERGWEGECGTQKNSRSLERARENFWKQSKQKFSQGKSARERRMRN